MKQDKDLMFLASCQNAPQELESPDACICHLVCYPQKHLFVIYYVTSRIASMLLGRWIGMMGMSAVSRYLGMAVGPIGWTLLWYEGEKGQSLPTS